MLNLDFFKNPDSDNRWKPQQKLFNEGSTTVIASANNWKRIFKKNEKYVRICNAYAKSR